MIDGQDGVQIMLDGFDRVMARDYVSARVKRQFRLTRDYGRVPNSYLQYYYYREETLAEAKASPKTRAEVILEEIPGYYQHFKEQINADAPRLTHVRGGSIFGDMAVEVMKGLVTQNERIHTLNVPNRTALPDFSPERIVEVPARLEHGGATTPLTQNNRPSEVVGLLHMLAEYQWVAADAIWNGTRQDLTRALATNPLILSLSLADDLLNTIIPLQKAYLPEDFLGRNNV